MIDQYHVYFTYHKTFFLALANIEKLRLNEPILSVVLTGDSFKLIRTLNPKISDQMVLVFLKESYYVNSDCRKNGLFTHAQS